jgi:hypothetical protein
MEIIIALMPYASSKHGFHRPASRPGAAEHALRSDHYAGAPIIFSHGLHEKKSGFINTVSRV